jgi:hypothetical protein
MAAPVLRIPLGAKLDDFEKGMKEASSKVGEATKQIAHQFANLNERAIRPAVAGAAAMGSAYAGAGLRTVATFAGVATAATLMARAIGAAIDSAKARIEDMVEVASRAEKLNVSPEFLQSIDLLAKGSKEAKDNLQAALEFFNQATRDRLNLGINPDEPEAVRRQITDVETAIRGIVEILPSANFGLDQFLSATDRNNAEGKMRAVLPIVVDLLNAGQRLEAPRQDDGRRSAAHDQPDRRRYAGHDLE